MSPKTLKALKGSIRKWELVVEGRTQDKGASNCPLCAEFLWDSCKGCPVRAATGRMGCHGTPYQNFLGTYQSEALELATIPYWRLPNQARVIGPETQQVAMEELEFLRSLLPGRK